MCGVGMIYGVYNHALNEDGTISDESLVSHNLTPGQEAHYIDYFGSEHGIKILPEGGEPYTWYIDGYLKTKRGIWHGMIDGDGRMKNPLAKPPFKRMKISPKISVIEYL